MNKKENLLIKLLYFAIGPLGAAIIGFITVPITTWLVTPEQFGMTTMFTLFQTLLTSFLYLGLDQSFIREYNEYKRKKENLLFNAMIIPAGISIFIMIFLWIFKESISYYLFGEVNNIIMIMMIFWIPFLLIERFLLINIRMQEKGLQYSLINIFVKLSVMIFTIGLLLIYEKTYTSIALGAIIGQIFGSSILLFVNSELFLVKKLKIEPDLIKKMLKYGLPLLPALVVMWILNSTDRIVLEYYTNLSEVGIYFTAMKLVSALSMVTVIFNNFWAPVAYRWQEQNVEKIKFTQVNYLLSFTIGLVFIAILLFKSFAVSIFDFEYREAQYILPFLLFSPLMYTLSESLMIGISIARKTHWIIWITAVAAITNMILNIVLVPFLGGIGAAIGTGFSSIVLFILIAIASRYYWYKFSLLPYIVNITILILLSISNILLKHKTIYLVNFLGLVVFCIINLYYLSKIFTIKNLGIIKRKK